MSESVSESVCESVSVTKGWVKMSQKMSQKINWWMLISAVKLRRKVRQRKLLKNFFCFSNFLVSLILIVFFFLLFFCCLGHTLIGIDLENFQHFFLIFDFFENSIIVAATKPCAFIYVRNSIISWLRV